MPLPIVGNDRVPSIARPPLGIISAVLCGVALTFVFHRYTLLSGFDLVQADPGDSRLIASILEHWFKVFGGIDDWRSPPWFFPRRETLGYSDVLLGMAIPYSVLRGLGAGMFEAANLTLVLLSLMSYLACLWLLRSVFAFAWPASAAGAAFFAFNYPKFAQLPHMQLRFDLLQPIILGLLLSLVLPYEMPSRRRTFITCLGAAVAFAVLASTTFLGAWFLLLLMLAALPVALLDGRLRRRLFARLRQRWAAACAGLVLGGLALLPLLALYGTALLETGGWPWSEALSDVPTPVQLVWMGTDNFAWGWLAAHRPDLDGANWPEMRIGYDVGATLAWLALVGFSATRMARGGLPAVPCEQQRDVAGPVVGALLIASLAIVLLGIRIGGHSPWYLVYSLVPGGSGVRSVSRYILTLSLPLAIGCACALDRFVKRPHGRLATALVVAVTLAVGGEQLARANLFSAAAAEEFTASLARMVDRRCSAFYLKPSPRHALMQPALDSLSLTERTFDASAYLSANPDVARDWKGTAWEHFVKHGRYENRNLSPTATRLDSQYQLAAMLAALASGVPTVNGISGRFPPGWELMGVMNPNIAARVNRWLLRNHRDEPACLVEHDLDGNEIPTWMASGFLSP